MYYDHKKEKIAFLSLKREKKKLTFLKEYLKKCWPFIIAVPNDATLLHWTGEANCNPLHYCCLDCSQKWE